MQDHNKKAMAGLTLAALGVVYGDIGTSPLYTLRECFVSQNLPTTPDNIFGILSLIFWSLIFVVSVKYVAFVLRADNRGEGGIMALMALARHYTTHAARWKIVLLGLFGAALFYGDAIITPAVSVLSAAEGMEVVSSGMEAYVLPMAVGVLVGLFLLQRHGTARVGLMFGPVMMVWFAILGILGLHQIIQQPAVLQALNPWHAVTFLSQHGFHAFLTLGSVVLALTGAEALYADMGHFGKTPIRRAWFSLVLPGLGLNYFGQGALLMSNPAAIKNPFFLLAPDWALLPMIALATLATVIASQAVISGAYSLTRQAILLGYCPRLEVHHTSDKEIGQIYMPFINWALLVAVLVVVLTFKNSSSLAAAYGIAVTGTMLITTMLFFVVARVNWRWPLPLALGITLLFGVIDTAFFAANVHKVADGGWLPLVMGMAIFTLMSTWKQGRDILFKRLREQALPLDDFIHNLEAYPPARVEGTAVFLTSTLHGVPHALLHNLKHNKVLHERVVLMTVRTEDIPYVPEDERLEIVQMSASFWRVMARYGFKEEPNVVEVLDKCAKEGFEMELMDTSFFLSRETIVSTGHPGMARWRQKIFLWMSKNALRATDFFQVPTNRVVELGAQVEL
ncbi:low affinity potassium transporter Kup [Chromobacterium violaceum]|uniref:Probable potassium transport system protein Kup 2 n=2 Tax=Chromobacterium violaceum TaxID=536 RepID=KUP2_CHRVO|nr:low affinity potassium transporter Kup [Chromobacterium violaceum]Q7P0J4.1 RecName: Full=Probable potassium transport system protein Kup 2 [Chromobacterium violaceum ATCC 12472]AAQ58249.1 potassium uptake protein [Chromobacterium violaceum ATCC 12472]ATP27392.1 potassium transporter Kup [Chromobacterium violaceum]ATP31309.1 potassium transporter Kup [Chromobacterium violaceum]KJH66560.1 potassium transport protein Kup [Chromobacterium violaceum]KMN50839.1 potassium transport protein Kup [C